MICVAFILFWRNLCSLLVQFSSVGCNVVLLVSLCKFHAFSFAAFQGASTNQNLMEWDKLWSINKRIIDPICPRHTAVLEDRRVMLSLTNGPVEAIVRILPRHKKFKDAGDKSVYYTKNIWIDYADAVSIFANEEVTLIDWGNAIIKEIKRDETGTIVQLIGVLHLEGSVKATK